MADDNVRSLTEKLRARAAREMFEAAFAPHRLATERIFERVKDYRAIDVELDEAQALLLVLVDEVVRLQLERDDLRQRMRRLEGLAAEKGT
jgi:hypothetical protein